MAIDWDKVEGLAVQGEAAWRSLVDDIRLYRVGRTSGLALSTTQKGAILARLKASRDELILTLETLKAEVA